MAKFIVRYLSDKTLYFVALNMTPAAWNGSELVTISDAAWATFRLDLQEIGTTGIYEGTIPAGLPADIYSVPIFVQAGAGALPSDVDIYALYLDWRGSAEASYPSTDQLEARTVTSGAYALEANVQTHAAAALAAYDPPTAAEMEARTLVAASYATAAKQGDIEADTQDLQSQIGTAGAGLSAIGDTRLANLDVAVTTRAVASTALSNATWTDTKAGYIDASVSSRSTLTAQGVWEYATRSLTTFGTLVADVAAAVWAIATSTLTAAGSIGKLIVDRFDAAISSRSSHSAADVKTALEAAGGHLALILEDTGTTLPATLATISGYVDCLPDAWVTVPTAAQVSTQVASDLVTAHGAGSWLTATGFSTLDAAGVRAAVGLAAANLDTQLSDLPTVSEFEARSVVAASYATATAQATILGYVDCLPETWVVVPTATQNRQEMDSSSTQLAAISAKTSNLPSDPANQSETNAIVVAAVSAIRGADADTLKTLSDQLDGTETAVRERTDRIPDTPAAVGSAMNLAPDAITTTAIDDGAITSAKFTVTAITGPATGILEQVRQVWRRFFARATVTRTALATYADDDTTVITTQAVSDDGTTQIVEAAE